MPELPEVETVVRLVRPRVVGRTVTGVEVTWPRTLGGLTRPAFGRAVVGARIASAWRRAKYMVFDLERGGATAGWLVGHLRMTGRLVVQRADEEPDEWRKVSLALDDGRVLRFTDVRKFGRFTFTTDLARTLGPLGPEPLSEDFTAEWLAAALKARRRMLKPLLLDQSFVAGLGNIYVDESLHRAGLHPLASSERLRRPQVERLHAEIRAVIAGAIEREGSSFDTFYRTPEGQPGSYQDEFCVYARDGLPCRTCGTTIRRLVVGQRGTHVCPRCQGRGPRRRAGKAPAAGARRPGR
jgi:formamidopyrimidine-DNA glycosylase